jgi:hypothetical protein
MRACRLAVCKQPRETMGAEFSTKQSRVGQVAVGIAASAYGVVALWGMWRSAVQASHRTYGTIWGPIWLVTGGTYVTGLVLLAVAAAGLGTALGNRPTMRVLYGALVARIGGEVLFAWPALIAVGLGLTPVHLPNVRAGEAYVRLGAWLALAGSVVTLLFLGGMALWVRREVIRASRTG